MENSVSARAYDKALLEGSLALSDALLAEYSEVLYRKKLDKYLNNWRRKEIISQIIKNSLMFLPLRKIEACRDPKDNHILELAIACEARCIVSGDQDLLILNPFEDILIVSGSDFLKL